MKRNKDNYSSYKKGGVKAIFEDFVKEYKITRKRAIVLIINDRTFEYDEFKEKCAFEGIDVKWKVVAVYRKRGEDKIREEVIYEEDWEWLSDDDWKGYEEGNNE